MAVQAPQMYSEGAHNLRFPLSAGAGAQVLFSEHPDGVGVSHSQNGFFFNAQQQPNSNRQILQMMENHKLEADLLITLQYERLRWAMQEQRKAQVAAVAKFYESRAAVLLRQKDEEISKGLQRMMELEQMMKGMEAENQAWEKLARESEAAVASMNRTMEQLRHGGEDVESCCGDTEEAVQNGAVLCRICSSRPSCMVLLPCRHLCSCDVCEGFIGTCPVCNVPKKASMEALF